jgi:hypothetical protein
MQVGGGVYPGKPNEANHRRNDLSAELVTAPLAAKSSLAAERRQAAARRVCDGAIHVCIHRYRLRRSAQDLNGLLSSGGAKAA